MQAKLKKWFGLSLVSAAHAETHIQVSAYSLVYPYVINYFNITYADLGLLLGAVNLINGLLQGVYGLLSNYIKRKYLCGGGNVMVGLTMIATAFSSSFPLFSTFRILGAIGSSPQHPTASSLISDWFERRERGKALTIHTSAGNIGTLIAPLIIGFLIPILGWRDALFIFGIPGFIFGILVMLLVEDRKSITIEQRKVAKSYIKVLKDTNILKLYAARSIIAGGRGLGVALTFIPLYLVNYLHLSSQIVGGLYTILAAGSVISPILGAHISDILGSRKLIIIPSLAMSASGSIILLLTGHNILGIIIALLIIGMFLFNEDPLSQALLSDIIKDERRDSAFSLYYMINYTSGAIWSIILGLILSLLGFRALFETMLFSYLVGALIISTVKEKD
ncbi:MFS transporter [Sulfolobus tengchongensis]|uniref:MFS transporter n=1 Tax=Sulfolobus tengchongensis TaxID=207809 RepID=A0AAX4L1Z9_9CREN